MSAAEDARDEGMERADRNADPVWKAHATEALEICARNYVEFTTDEVWTVLERMGVEPPHEPRAISGIIRTAKKDGLIEFADQRKSRMVRSHARPKQVYRSRLYK